MKSYNKMGHDMTKQIFSKYFAYHGEQYQPWFRWVKTNFKWSKYTITGQISDKWSKWRHFRPKMTSYVKNRAWYDIKRFFKYFIRYVEQPQSWFWCVKTKLKWSKFPITGQIRGKWSKWRHFGPKWHHTPKMGHDMSKNIFKIFPSSCWTTSSMV